MKHPKDDISTRTPVWESLQMFFMDTDPGLFLENVASVCWQSPYTIKEIENILFNEVLPACRFNMFNYVTPAWTGFETTWLVQRVLKKHLFGRRRPLLFRRYTTVWWRRLEPMIRARRGGGEADPEIIV